MTGDAPAAGPRGGRHRPAPPAVEGRRWWTAVVLGAAVLAAAGRASAQPGPTPAQDPAEGARLFQVKGCIACHAPGGAGESAGPALGRMAPPRSVYEVAAAMWNHLPAMARQIWAAGTDRPYLTPDQMSDLVAFLGGAAGPPRLVDEPGDRQRGQALAAEKGCLACHSLSGTGGPRAGSLDRLRRFVDSPWVAMATMWNHAFLMEIEAQGRRLAWPRFSAAEMADLVAFLRAGRAGP